MTTTTILLCGVGGQGTILAAKLLSAVALKAGLQVKVSEIHGMSQRGGSVVSTVRFGEEVASMIHDKGDCDFVIAFETVEALRNISYIKADGYMIASDESIKPLPVLSGSAQMPADAIGSLKSVGAILVPAVDIAREAGNVKTSNVALLGALSTYMDFPVEIWEEAIAQGVPQKAVDVNIEAFRKGRAVTLA